MHDLKLQTFIGVVADNKDPRKLGRCRVRVVNIFDEIPTDDIPWATPWKDLNGNSFMVPEVGKVVTVIFDQGNIYKPEFIYSEHYNINLENKLQALDQNSDPKVIDDYSSMKALLFDHNTQIYVNEGEGLIMEHKYNQIHIDKGSINLNLSENNSNLNLGDCMASQQAILGNHFLNWFDVFLDLLLSSSYLGNLGAPVVPMPPLLDHITKYKALKDPKFLSKHVRIVDNETVNYIPNTVGSFPVHRQNFGQAGDILKTFLSLYNLARRIKDAPRPKKKRKKRIENGYKPPQLTPNPDSPNSSPPVQNSSDPDNAKPSDGLFNTSSSPATSKGSTKVDPQRQIEFYEEEDEIAKLVRYLESKTGNDANTGKSDDYEIYEDPYVMNIVAFRNRNHEYGKISNTFDDEMWVFYKNERNQWEMIRKYTVTTVPGYKVVDGKKVDPPILPDNVGFINYGQYINSYKMGHHNPDTYGKRHPCLVCDKVGIRMNKKKGEYVKDRYVNTVVNTQFGVDIDGWVYDTGMNIHCTIPTDESVYGDENYPKATVVFDEVNNWSTGCIVFNNPNQYREFLGLCDEQMKKGKKSQFTVTVASYREFELFETDLDVGDESSESLGDDLQDRFPDLESDVNY